ncbi:unnamed protein product [Caenorhabditis brenneri]
MKVVSVSFSKLPDRNKHFGSIKFDSSLRNLTSRGPRDIFGDEDDLVYGLEEYDNIQLRNYEINDEPTIEIPEQNSIDHCISITRQLYKLLPTTPFRYTFYIRGYNDNLKQHLTTCLVGDYEKVTICGGREILTYDQMDFIFNFVKPDAYFEYACKMMDDFKHEKAFQFKSFFYHHAEWITLDDLKSLRNHNIVRLGSTKFTSKDVNKFLKYWSESDEPMMNIFSVHLGHPLTFAEKGDRREMCVPQLILHRLEYFGLAEQSYSKESPLVYYIKSKTGWAELRVSRTRVEFTTETCSFGHENAEEAISLVENLGSSDGSDETRLKMKELGFLAYS